jgi:hypothetical protein
MTPLLEWQFGGVLHAWPPLAAWGLLAALAVLGFLAVVWLYRRTVLDLSPAGRYALTALRAVLVLLLLLCLANPTRVERARPNANRRRLAVLVDRSESMSQPDHRGTTRLAHAVRVWKQHEAEAANAFATVTHGRFAVNLVEASSFENAVEAREPGPETHLYDALRKTVDSGASAVVCLTDGLDTTSAKADELIALAQQRAAALYFVVANNRLRAAGGSLGIREVKMPARVLRQTRFTAEALLEVFSPADEDLPAELWSGETKLASARLPVRAGLNALPWSVPVTAGEPGLMPLEIRFGQGATQQIAGRTTRIVEHTTVDVLYYQGALQWGYRFVRGALESDPSFRLTSILNPALGLQITTASMSRAALPDLPDDAADLNRFQIVLLAHVFADQLSARQQRALVNYVRSGGGVLFIASDTEATRRFSGTELEQMLPVVFESPVRRGSDGVAEARFQEQMRAAGGSASGLESAFANNVLRSQTLAPLVPFAAPAGAKESKLFRPGPDAPQFCSYAQVRSAKPGAEILAVHPRDRVPGANTPRVLLARQQFGNGFSAVLTTDLLWRWKLSMPSTNHAAEVFWQQFMLSLSPPPAAEGLRLVRKTKSPAVNRAMTVLAEGGAVSLVLVSPGGVERKLTTTEVAGEKGTRQAVFTPDAEGRWEVRANGAGGDTARITFNVSAKARSVETMNLPPDVEGLRRLAEATGGALIESGEAVFAARATADEPPARVKRMQPLWYTRWLAALLLGIYGTELVARRMLRLL